MDTLSCHGHIVSVLQNIFKDGWTGFGNDTIPDDCQVDSTNLQYGEITYAGMEQLYRALQVVPGDVFYDLGSGTGKLVFYVAMKGQVARSIGIEVGEKRHASALLACERFKTFENTEANGGSAVKDRCAPVQMLLQDISRRRFDDATVAVMCNLCMDQGVQRRTLNNLLKCSSLRRLVCATPLIDNRLQLKTTIKVPCTWAKISSWQVYDVLAPGQRSLPPALARVDARINRSDNVAALRDNPVAAGPAPSRADIVQRLHKAAKSVSGLRNKSVPKLPTVVMSKLACQLDRAA
jgi:hypothetical protein